MEIVLMGPSGAGKSTLLHALSGNNRSGIPKTQTLEFHGSFVDTPGEYLHLPHFHHVLITEANRGQVVLLVQDATAMMLQTPPGFVSGFRRPVLGAITKIDRPEADVERARRWMEMAGVHPRAIFPVSGIRGDGVPQLRDALWRYGTNPDNGKEPPNPDLSSSG